MKKLLILLAATMLLLAGCVNTLEADNTAAATTSGVTATIDHAVTFVPQPKEPAQLSEEMEKQMRETRVYYEGVIRETVPPGRDYEFIILAYYGTYNGCVVIYTGPSAYPIDWETTVAGIDFYASAEGILVWKEDSFMSLWYAYDQGFLTENDLMNIAYYHSGKVGN